MKVVVTGATGFIGSALIAKLREHGDEVIAFVRDIERAKQRFADTQPALPEMRFVQADLETPGLWCDALDGVDTIVHLAGEPVATKRWDARQKQLIRDSRVESTRTIVEAIGKTTARPKAFVVASGTDYYPFADRGDDFDDDEVSEAAKPSDTFLARVCRDLEREANAAEPLGLRVVAMRNGIVLGKHGVALEKLRQPFDLHGGGKLGSGRQWMSWIHLADAVAAYATAVADERYRGPINVVTDSTRNADFARALGKALGRRSWLRAPAFAIKAVAGGEFAQSILEGRRVVPRKLRELGFVWKYPTLEATLEAAL